MLALPKNLTIAHGQHDTFGEGACALELVDYLDRRRAGKRVRKADKLTDHPACTSPVIAAFVRGWNDALPDDATRTRLLAPLLPLMLDTADAPAVETRRAWMAVDWLARVHVPAWLELAGLGPHAAALRGLGVLRDAESAGAARPAIDAAWAAAGAAAWDAARAAAGAAARAAAGPTVALLQASAQDLVRSMCEVRDAD
jgi:hypothetical protein